MAREPSRELLRKHSWMNLGIFTPSNLFTRNDLYAMLHSRDLLPFGGGFVAWDFIEDAHTRLIFLRLNFRMRGVPVGETANWVRNGGAFPKEIELEEPRRKPYC